MTRGRGHKKIEQDGLVKTIADEHGIPVVRLPKFLLKMGVKLNQEVRIIHTCSNPLAWEIRIVPTEAKDNSEP